MTSNQRLKTGFGQVSNTVMRDATLNLKEKGLYAYLSTYAHNTSNQLNVSITRMAADCGCTESTIKRCIRSLMKKGIIQRRFNRKGVTYLTVLLK